MRVRFGVGLRTSNVPGEPAARHGAPSTTTTDDELTWLTPSVRGSEEMR